MTAVAQVRCEQVGDLTVCRIAGEIDPTNVADVQKAVLEAPVGGTRSTGMRRGLVMDLDRLAFIDSAGIAMLFELARHLRQENIPIAVAVPPEAPIRRVLDLARLDDVAILAPTLEAAAEALTT